MFQTAKQINVIQMLYNYPISSSPPQHRQAKPESETMIRRAGLVYYLLSSTNKGCRMGG